MFPGDFTSYISIIGLTIRFFAVIITTIFIFIKLADTRFKIKLGDQTD